jgi:serine/threonine protein phosphatase 1
MERLFFIGDIHGCSKTFRKLITGVIGIRKSDSIYCIGDYIDRGPGSREVIDFIISLRQSGFRVYTLRGNHEQMLLDSGKGANAFSLWLMNGGDTTLESFKCRFSR